MLKKKARQIQNKEQKNAQRNYYPASRSVWKSDRCRVLVSREVVDHSPYSD